jgi:hypothetical protein
MTPLLKKLNFKEQKEIFILHAPKEFGGEMTSMSNFTTINKQDELRSFTFMISFVTQQEQVNEIVRRWCPLAVDDALLWFAYPKKSSKNYKSDFNRDTGWQVLGDLGWEGVRIVALDDDWSALRFRKVEYIQTMTRSFAISAEGKKKANK